MHLKKSCSTYGGLSRVYHNSKQMYTSAYLIAARESVWLEREERARQHYEKHLEERRKKLEEQRLKEERRRTAVEEKRRQRIEEDKVRESPLNLSACFLLDAVAISKVAFNLKVISRLGI